MKKTTLLALSALLSLAAQAQYTVDPSNSLVINQKPATVDYIILSENAVNEFTAAGTKMNDLQPNDVDRFLYVWDNTFNAGDSSYPRVDMEEGGYVSLSVGSVGWSGAGFCLTTETNLGHFNENTRFHLAYMTPNDNAPASLGIIILGGETTKPAKVALGAAYDDNGVIYPAVGPKASDDWNGIDISFGDLKKLFPEFDWTGSDKYKDNIFSFLAGGVTGQAFSFDALYFYNLDGAGIEGVESVGGSMVVTGKTINVPAGQGIELFNLAGQMVKNTKGCVLGLEGLDKGVYVAKSGREVRKVVVR